MRHARCVHLQRQPRGRERARDGDGDALERSRAVLADDDHGTVTVAHAGAVRQERVAIGEVGERVEGDRGDLEAALECPAVQALDIGEHLLDLEVTSGHGPAREAVEHERVVGIGAVGQGEFHNRSRNAKSF